MAEGLGECPPAPAPCRVLAAFGPCPGSPCLALSPLARPLHPCVPWVWGNPAGLWLGGWAARGHQPRTPAGGCDQLLSLLVAWRKFLLPQNPGNWVFYRCLGWFCCLSLGSGGRDRPWPGVSVVPCRCGDPGSHHGSSLSCPVGGLQEREMGRCL